MRIFIVVVFVLLSHLTYSQNSLKGKVTHKDKPLEGVIVQLLEADSTTLVNFAITNINGNYEINYNGELSKRILDFSCLGYHRFIKKADSLDVEMQIKPMILKEVVVKAPAIKSNGDTISYNANSFVKKADRTLEDLLKSIPGILVRDNGKIEYKGEAISKFYIEGIDMLGGKYTLASKNIHVSDISSIKVYENHQPIKLLKEISISNKSAIDVKIKKSRLGRVRGDIALGGGLVTPKIGYISEVTGLVIGSKKQSISILKSSDMSKFYTSEVVDLIRNKAYENPKSFDLIKTNPFSTPNLPSKSYLKNQSSLLTFNGILKAHRGVSFAMGVNLNTDTDRYKSSKKSIYINDIDTVLFSEKINHEIKEKNLELNCKIEKNTDSIYFIEKVDLFSKLINCKFPIYNNEVYYDEFHTKRLWNLTNKFDIKKKIRGNIYGISSYVSLSNNPETSINVYQTEKILNQKVKGYSLHSLHSTLFSWSISSSSNIGVDLSLASNRDKLKLKKKEYNGEPERVEVTGTQFILRTMAHYIYNKNKWRFKVQVPIRNILMNFKEKGEKDFQNHSTLVDFSFLTKYNISPLFSISFNGGKYKKQGGIMDFFSYPIYTNYNSIEVGGVGGLSKRSIKKGSFSFDYTNTMEGIFCRGGVSISKIDNNLIRNITVTNIVNTEIKKTNNSSNVRSGTLFFAKNFRSLGIVLSSNISLDIFKKKILRNDALYDIKTTSIIVNPLIKIKTFERANIEADFLCSFMKNNIKKSITEMVTDYECKLDFSYMPLKNIEFNLISKYYKKGFGNGVYKESILSDLNIRYIASRVELLLSCNNIFNEESYSYRIYKGVDNMSFEYTLRPRNFNLTVRFRY